MKASTGEAMLQLSGADKVTREYCDLKRDIRITQNKSCVW